MTNVFYRCLVGFSPNVSVKVVLIMSSVNLVNECRLYDCIYFVIKLNCIHLVSLKNVVYQKHGIYINILCFHREYLLSFVIGTTGNGNSRVGTNSDRIKKNTCQIFDTKNWVRNFKKALSLSFYFVNLKYQWMYIYNVMWRHFVKVFNFVNVATSF